MKAERNYPRYTVTAKAEAAILRGHPWVYDAEITATEGQAENGGLVDVISKKGRYLGTGFLSIRRQRQMCIRDSVGAVQDPGAAGVPQRQ